MTSYLADGVSLASAGAETAPGETGDIGCMAFALLLARRAFKPIVTLRLVVHKKNLSQQKNRKTQTMKFEEYEERRPGATGEVG